MCLEKHRSLGLLGEPDAPDARHEAARHEAARGAGALARVGDRRQETGHRRQDTGDRRQETGHRRQEAGDRRQDTGHRTQETGDRRQDTGCRRQETGGTPRGSTPRSSTTRGSMPRGSTRCRGSGEGWSVLREAWGLTCDGSVLGVGVDSQAGVDAAPPLEESGGVNSAGRLGGDCPTTQTDSGDCSIGPRTEWGPTCG